MPVFPRRGKILMITLSEVIGDCQVLTENNGGNLRRIFDLFFKMEKTVSMWKH